MTNLLGGSYTISPTQLEGMMKRQGEQKGWVILEKKRVCRNAQAPSRNLDCDKRTRERDVRVKDTESHGKGKKKVQDVQMWLQVLPK